MDEFEAIVAGVPEVDTDLAATKELVKISYVGMLALSSLVERIDRHGQHGQEGDCDDGCDFDPAHEIIVELMRAQGVCALAVQKMFEIYQAVGGPTLRDAMPDLVKWAEDGANVFHRTMEKADLDGVFDAFFAE